MVVGLAEQLVTEGLVIGQLAVEAKGEPLSLFEVDSLEGLKENVIVGRLIPAGTGATMNQLREVALKRDALILEEREKEAARVAEAAEAAEAAKTAEEPAALPAAE